MSAAPDCRLLPFYPHATILPMPRYRVRLTVDSNVIAGVVARLEEAKALGKGIPEGLVEVLEDAVRFIQLPLSTPEAVTLHRDV